MNETKPIADLFLILEIRRSDDQNRDRKLERLVRLLTRNASSSDDGVFRIRMPLAEAGVLRDVIFDLLKAGDETTGSAMFLDGQSLDLEGLKHVLAVYDCAQAHGHADGTSSDHCSNVNRGWNWGCRYLASMPPPFDEQGRDDADTFHNQLLQEAKRRFLTFCPYFDPARLKTLVLAGGNRQTLDAAGLDPDRNPDHFDEIAQAKIPSVSSIPDRSVPVTTYADVGGLDEAVRQVREAVDLPISHPEVFTKLGIPHHRGVLLHGPPGCGKTLLARAVAHQPGASFFPVSGPELITKWHGESEERLRLLFDEARQRQPSIVFFDEIDAIAQARSSDENLRLDSRFTTQLLTIMDGIHDLGRVFVLATTNRLDLLDSALLRPGRLDRIIEIPLPDAAGRLAILRIHARKMPLDSEVDLDRVSENLKDLTGADIACLVREAALVCLRRTLDMDDLLARQCPLADDDLEKLRIDCSDFDQALLRVRQRAKTLVSPIKESATG